MPWLNASATPYSGAQAYFYDAGTLTPHCDPERFPVVANSGGMFPPVFPAEQIHYHLRIEDAGVSTIWVVDNISVPTTVVPDPPSGAPTRNIWC